MLLLLLAQAVAGPRLPAPPRPRSDKPCPIVIDSTDVVVCARDQESFRLHPAPTAPEREGLPKAQVRIGDVAVAAEGEAVGLPLGYFTNRAMVRLRIPIGGKKKKAAP